MNDPKIESSFREIWTRRIAGTAEDRPSERALQIAVAGTAALSSALLGAVENNFTLSITAGIASFVALLLTDMWRVFSLNHVGSTILALAALATTVYRVEIGATEDRLVSISDLLIYLQLILQFQTKHGRLYWQLLTLSLLEVVVAAALNLGLGFGLFLVLYLVLAVTSLVLLNIRILADREAKQFAREAVRVTPSKEGNEKSFPLSIDLRALSCHDTLALMVNRRLVWQIVHLVGSTMLLAILVFFATPRLTRSGSVNSLLTSGRQAGLSHSVSLNQVAEIADNGEVVMRVQFSKWGLKEPYILNGEPYFHGIVLSSYSPNLGQWRGNSSGGQELHETLSMDPPESADVQERVLLEPGVADTFSVFPAYGIDDESQSVGDESHSIRQLIGKDALMRFPEAFGRRADGVQYDIRTSCFRHGMPRSIRPVVDMEISENPQRLEKELIECLSFPRTVLPTAESTAADVLARRKINPERRVEAALCLESFLRRNEDFTYSKERRPPRETTVDPIENFLKTDHTGHCEFFASALAMMLRSQGIPARLVIGYRGGDYNSFGQYYAVTQSNAHAWVEVYLRPDDLSEQSLMKGESPDLGGWLRLDPTPSASEKSTYRASTAWLLKVRALQDYLQHLWKDYVLGLNYQRQRQLIYRPLVDRTSAGIRGTILSGGWWIAFGQTLNDYLGLRSPAAFRDRWFHWRSVPLLMGIFLFAMGIRQLFKRYWYWIAPVLTRVFRQRTAGPNIDPRLLRLVRRWELGLARRGWRREANQTLREFAEGVQEDFSSDPRLAPHGGLLETWICLYYRARYGIPSDKTSDWEELERLQRQLDVVLRAVRRTTRTAVPIGG